MLLVPRSRKTQVQVTVECCVAWKVDCFDESRWEDVMPAGALRGFVA